MLTSSRAARVRLLFVTYSVISPDDEPEESAHVAMMGVLKRCLRLINLLSPASFECHLLHFGSLPAADPLVRLVAGRLTVHAADWEDPVAGSRDLFIALDPDVVVLGEGPGSGMMEVVSAVALRRGIPQVCVENYYHPAQPMKFVVDAPWIRHWFLLGLPVGRPYGRLTERTTLVPPLLPEDDLGCPWADVTILGYDPAVTRLGLALLDAMPATTSARLIGTSHHSVSSGALRTLPSPTDGRLHGYLRRSGVVVCKNGFQQMVESLAAGTPVVAFEARGGVNRRLLCEEMRPFVRYARRAVDLPECVTAARSWCELRPDMPWMRELARFPSPSAFSAACFVQVLRAVAGGAEPSPLLPPRHAAARPRSESTYASSFPN